MSINRESFFSFLFFVLLLAIVASYLLVDRLPFFPNIFSFDLYLLFYILVSIIHFLLAQGKILILPFTGKLIILLNLALLPSLTLLVFSNEILGGLAFLSQYFFSFIVIPLFLNFLILNKHLKTFFQMVFFGYIAIASLYIYTTLLSSYMWSDYFKFLGVGDNLYGARFFLGELTPNEMGHYFVFFLLSSIYLKSVSNKSSNFYFSSPLVYLTFFMTMSKTVWLQIVMSLFLISNKIKFLLLALGVFSFSYAYLFYNDLVIYWLKDFSTGAASNQARIQMALDSIKNLPNTIFYPAYYQVGNLADQSLKVTSAHNGFLSFLTNFGILSFALTMTFFGTFILINIKKSNLVILSLILIDLVVLTFNPLINARQVWLPLFTLIFFYAYNQTIVSHSSETK